MGMTFRLAVTAGLGAVAVALACWWAYGPVSRARLEGFARQHGLPITTGNGDLVIAYLTITRRWRCAGAAAGTLASLALRLADGEPGVDLLAVFAGWFAGALIAELVLVPEPTGERRSASLAVRRATDYVHPMVWALPLVAGAGWIVATAWAVAAGRQPSGWAFAALAVLGPVLVVRRRILLRPQPAGPADVTEAETAIRGRSLRVLSSAGFALAAYCALALPVADSAPGTVAGLLVLIVARFAGAVVPARYRIRPA